MRDHPSPGRADPARSAIQLGTGPEISYHLQQSALSALPALINGYQRLTHAMNLLVAIKRNHA